MKASSSSIGVFYKVNILHSLIYSILYLICPANSFLPSYIPTYCSKGNLTELRAIPKLKPYESSKVSHLKQVQVLIRHGGKYFQYYTIYSTTVKI